MVISLLPHPPLKWSGQQEKDVIKDIICETEPSLAHSSKQVERQQIVWKSNHSGSVPLRQVEAKPQAYTPFMEH